MSRAVRPLASLAVALLLVASVSAGAAAAEPTFGDPSARSTFGTGISFSQAIDSPIPLARVEILLTYPDSIGPYVAEVAGATAAGPRDFTWSLDLEGGLVPNTRVTARWRLVPEDRSQAPVVGPPVEGVYEDTRFDWQTRSGDLVRLHWYEGGASFGRQALEIGERAVREASELLGVTEEAPIDFFVYASEDAFYDALGPGTRENVGGQAHSDIRTMFALIGPGDVDDAWVGIVIPHELTHLVFDTAVDNPYHFPPRWLNEGVAVYLSEGYKASDRVATEEAARAGRLMPLRALGGQFPTSAERFFLAYAESVSAVDFLVREHGTAALVALIRGYADGVTDDEAFETAIGTDLAGFEAAWLADLGAAAPVQHGPVAAPAGPVPPGWEAGAPTSEPGATAGPGATGEPAPTPGGSDDGSPWRDGAVLLGVALAGLVVGGLVALVARRRRGVPAPPAGLPGRGDPGPSG